MLIQNILNLMLTRKQIILKIITTDPFLRMIDQNDLKSKLITCLIKIKKHNIE